MNDLEQEIQELAQREIGLKQQLEQAMTLQAKENIMSELNIVSDQLKERRDSLNKLQTRNAIIDEAQNPESSFTLTVDGYTVDFRTESASEEAYQTLRIVTQLKLQELEQQNQTEIKALKASYEIERQQYEMQINALEEGKADALQVNETLKQDNKQLSDQLHDVNLQNSNLERKRAIAASEIESLKAQVDELRVQVSKPNVPTNLDNGALAEAIRLSQAAKPAIYDVERDQANINFTAKLLETDEVVEGKVVYIGKYRIADIAEVQRFREEREANKDNIPDDTEPDTSDMEVEETEAITFPEVLEDEPLQEHTVHGEVAEEATGPDGGESFEQEMRRRVELLESAVYGIEKAA